MTNRCCNWSRSTQQRAQNAHLLDQYLGFQCQFPVILHVLAFNCKLQCGVAQRQPTSSLSALLSAASKQPIHTTIERWQGLQEAKASYEVWKRFQTLKATVKHWVPRWWFLSMANFFCPTEKGCLENKAPCNFQQ
ncbi:unnamed protein product [Caretta caretta]